MDAPHVCNSAVDAKSRKWAVDSLEAYQVNFCDRLGRAVICRRLADVIDIKDWPEPSPNIRGHMHFFAALPDARRRRRHAVRAAWLVVLVGIGAVGCSSILPRSINASSAFLEFESLRAAIDSLQPMKSDRAELARLGIDPGLLPNTVILSYPDLLRRFVTGAAVGKQDLDAGVVQCLEARDACRGWELQVSRIARARTGSFLPDFVNFRRRTETTGWRFNALILLVNDMVVYRAWGGQPAVNQVEVNTNPLGPLQDIGTAAIVSPM